MDLSSSLIYRNNRGKHVFILVITYSVGAGCLIDLTQYGEITSEKSSQNNGADETEEMRSPDENAGMPDEFPGPHFSFWLVCATTTYEGEPKPLSLRIRVWPDSATERFSLDWWVSPAYELVSDQDTATIISSGQENLHGIWDETEVKFVWTEGTLHLSRSDAVQDYLYTGSMEFVTGTSVLASCWSDGFAADFKYDSSTGKCLNAEGMEGNNIYPAEMLRETKNGECGKFLGIELNEGDYSYPVLATYNLQGARLEGASMISANLTDTQLQGVDLSQFEFKESQITGVIDSFSIVPADHCEIIEDKVSCYREN